MRCERRGNGAPGDPTNPDAADWNGQWETGRLTRGIRPGCQTPPESAEAEATAAELRVPAEDGARFHADPVICMTGTMTNPGTILLPRSPPPQGAPDRPGGTPQGDRAPSPRHAPRTHRGRGADPPTPGGRLDDPFPPGGAETVVCGPQMFLAPEPPVRDAHRPLPSTGTGTGTVFASSQITRLARAAPHLTFRIRTHTPPRMRRRTTPPPAAGCAARAAPDRGRVQRALRRTPPQRRPRTQLDSGVQVTAVEDPDHVTSTSWRPTPATSKNCDTAPTPPPAP